MFKVYADPGHSWIMVKISLLKDLGISTQMTPYSYVRGEYAYLEEDMDMPLFLKTYKEKFGIEPKLVKKHTNRRSRIRSYDDYLIT